MKNKTLIACGIILACSCATARYSHPTKTAEDFRKDNYECDKIAEQSAADWGSPGNPLMIIKERRRCMEEKMGWERE